MTWAYLDYYIGDKYISTLFEQLYSGICLLQQLKTKLLTKKVRGQNYYAGSMFKFP